MKKLEFFEVNFGELQIHPLMTAKCFSTCQLALDYLLEIRDKLLKELKERGLTLVIQDYRLRSDNNYADSVHMIVVKDFFSHIDVYEIKLIRHAYILED